MFPDTPSTERKDRATSQHCTQSSLAVVDLQTPRHLIPHTDLFRSLELIRSNAYYVERIHHRNRYSSSNMSSLFAPSLASTQAQGPRSPSCIEWFVIMFGHEACSSLTFGRPGTQLSLCYQPSDREAGQGCHHPTSCCTHGPKMSTAPSAGVSLDTGVSYVFPKLRPCTAAR